MNRRAEKLELIARIEHSKNSAPQELHNTAPALYSKVMINGNFVEDKHILLYGRKSHQSEKNGYYLVSPFKSDDGKIYLVARAWIAHSDKDKALEFIASSTRKQTIEAILMPGERRGFMVPENDFENSVWFNLDLDAAKEALGITESGFYLMQINSPHMPDGFHALSANRLTHIRNDHLEYAITWYSLAAALLLMACVRYFRARG